LRDRRIAGIFLGYFAYDYVWLLFITWVPGYLMMERKFAPHELALYVSLPYLVTSVVTILTGICSDAFVRRGFDEITVRKSFITAGLLIGCLVAPAGFVEDGRLSALLIAGAVCGLGIVGPNGWVLTQAVCGRERVGVGAGIQNLGGNLGGVVAPAVTGLVAHVTGSFAAAFAIAGAVLLFGIAAYWILIPGGAGGGRSGRMRAGPVTI
jgi:sugar phosphate permease